MLERLTALRDKALDGSLTQTELDREALAAEFDIAMAGEHYLNEALERQRRFDDELATAIG